MTKIDDFGEKIGGARKDMWRGRGLMVSDLAEMNEAEQKSFVKKDNIWPRPDWTQLIIDGTPQAVAYWQNEMRKAIPPKPVYTADNGIEDYVKTVQELKEAVMKVSTVPEIDSFYEDVFKPGFLESSSYSTRVKDEAESTINWKSWNTIRNLRSYNCTSKAQETLFGIPKDQKVYVETKQTLSVQQYNDNTVEFKDWYGDIQLSVRHNLGRSYCYLKKDDPLANKENWQTDCYFVFDKSHRKPLKINLSSREEAEAFIETTAKERQELANNSKGKSQVNRNGKKTKTAFTPPQLAGLHREGPKYHKFDVKSEQYLDDLKFRAGEFGVWLNENDRQTSLNMCYDAMRDLARVLNIRPEDISLNGTLAIAWGARGKGGAGAGAAHYEPMRQVINLTKMSGAGCLAHEWGHALDHAIGIASGLGGLASEKETSYKIPESFSNVLKAMRYKEVTISEEEVRASLEVRIKNKEAGLKGWIPRKPKELPEAMSNTWDAIVKEILDHTERFTGLEYQGYNSYIAPETNKEVEALALIYKKATKKTLPKKEKVQISLWAREVEKVKIQLRTATAQVRSLDSEYYKGSGKFDESYSKAGHGYWQSTCEMFARAFDCYISDKLKEAGQKSDYLTAYADSFVRSENGETYAAIPQGDERKLINEKIDLLIEDLKERGILHDYVEEIVEEIDTPELTQEVPEPEFDRKWEELSVPQHFEQMSFDDMLFNASLRAEEHNRELSAKSTQRDKTR